MEDKLKQEQHEYVQKILQLQRDSQPIFFFDETLRISGPAKNALGLKIYWAKAKSKVLQYRPQKRFEDNFRVVTQRLTPKNPQSI